ncbi:MAG: cell division protein FtsQ/DivIB [Rhodobacteraceae bacterium]|nr:cell division protein FtsQ/DivIB [Paracoccaceae bacterium]
MPQIATMLRRIIPTTVIFRLQRILLTWHWRRLFFYVLPMAVVAIAGYGLLISKGNGIRLFNQGLAAFQQAVHTEQSRIHGFQVHATSEHLEAEIAALVSLDFPADIFSIDAESLLRTIEALPAVVSADVKIQPGGSLVITAVGRRPVAVWRNGERLSLLDGDGIALVQSVDRKDYIDLPLVAGGGAIGSIPEAVQLYHALEELQDSLQGLLRVGNRRWDLILDGGRRVLLPEKDPVRAVNRLMFLNRSDALLQRQLRLVDLRDPGLTIVRLTDSSLQLLKPSLQDNDL